jgi:hypothetical protein
MDKIDSTWEQRVADLWKAIDNYEPDAFVAQIDALALELPPITLSASSSVVRRKTPRVIPTLPFRSIGLL